MFNFLTKSLLNRSASGDNAAFLHTLICALCLTAFATVASAQTQKARNLEAALWQAETAEQTAAAQANLEDAAQAGNPTAQYHLARHLLYGWVLDQDKAKGLEMLEALAEKQYAPALRQLGQDYLWGSVVPRDRQRAVAYLEDAIAQGDVPSHRILGEQLVTGDVLSRDLDRGMALLSDAIEAGDTETQVVLGKLYLTGAGVARDWDAALTLFEAAAEAGNGHGLAAYGEALMWSQRDAGLAEAMLNKAAALGAHEAWVTLANGASYGYLGGGRVSRAKYADYAESALAANQQNIAVIEAERRMWGINVRASGPEALEILTNAAMEGNAPAARKLVELLRDGNDLNIRRRPEEARAALARFGDMFNDKQRQQYELSIEAAQSRQAEQYGPMAATYNARTDLHSVWMATQLASANPNIAFYILQEKLAAQGLYNGSISGFATPATLRAAARACRELNLNTYCADNVLEPSVVGALITRTP